MPTAGFIHESNEDSIIVAGRDINEIRRDRILNSSNTHSLVDALIELPVNRENVSTFTNGQKLLVKAFNYGSGFEIVDNNDDPGTDFSLYEIIVVKKVRPRDSNRYYMQDYSTSFSTAILGGTDMPQAVVGTNNVVSALESFRNAMADHQIGVDTGLGIAPELSDFEVVDEVEDEF